MNYMGVDLGKVGGVVILNKKGEVIYCSVEKDFEKIYDFILNNCKDGLQVMIEDVLCYFGKGVYAIRALSAELGKWELLLELLYKKEKIKIMGWVVRPTVWQHILLANNEGETTKERAFSFVKGKTTHPGFESLKRGKNDGLFDAFCLAFLLKEKYKIKKKKIKL